MLLGRSLGDLPYLRHLNAAGIPGAGLGAAP